MLVALQLSSHVHHDRAHRWFGTLRGDHFATCAITQGTLLRVHMRMAVDRTAAAAWRALTQIVAHEQHEWWGDELSYLDVKPQSLHSSSHLTDAWLAELTRRRQARLATMDTSLAALHPDVAVLIP